MSSSDEVIAILCSDIHLSSRAPIARSAEECWFKAMDRQLSQLRKLQKKYDCPVICAGDIFDRWYSTPELINFALDYLPEMYAVPGQHDMPEHSMEEIRRSAYWTLVRAGLVEHVEGRFELGRLILYGSGWGQPIEPVPKKDRRDKRVKLAVIHKYCWSSKKSCYPGAPQDGYLPNILKACEGVDGVLTGDNHKQFYTDMPEEGEPFHLNPGSFFRRKSDEVDLKPCVGLVYDNGGDGGYLRTVKLECSDDKFIDIDKGLELLDKGLDLTELVDDLKSLGNGTLDFVESLFQYMDKNGIAKSVRKILTQSMERNRSDEPKPRKS